MKDLERVTLLIDFYGPLLTSRQQELLKAYYLEDLSLGEIAEQEQVSRQAVHDQIRRAESALAQMEAKVGWVAEHHQRLEQLQRLRELLHHIHLGGVTSAELGTAIQLVDDLLEPERAVDG